MNADAPRNEPRQSGTPSSRCVIEGFALGPFETNCYLVYVPGAVGCWIVDASFGPSPLIERARELGLTPEALLLTHAHVDHIAGVDEVLAAFPGTPVVIHAAEREWLKSAVLNLSAGAGLRVTAHGPDRTYEDGEFLTLAGSR